MGSVKVKEGYVRTNRIGRLIESGPHYVRRECVHKRGQFMSFNSGQRRECHRKQAAPLPLGQIKGGFVGFFSVHLNEIRDGDG